MNEQTQPAFRIGGYYRDGFERLVRLSVNAIAGTATAEAFNGEKWFGYMQCFRLADGKWMGDPGGKSNLHLIPGELNAQGEPIASTFYCAAETIDVATEADTFNDAMWRALKPAIDWRNNPFELSHAGAYERNRQMRDAQVKPAEPWVREKLRPRLTWADSKPFDNLEGFSSSSDTATPDHAYSHPLTRVADAGAQTNPKNGSAYLVG